VKVRVKVIPNSKIEGVIREGDGFLVRVKEPAKEGKANRAVIKLLADHFGVSRRQVIISSGVGSRNKVIEVLEIK
jgi:uncharacterized protein (TIGR00251 family)